MNYEKRVAKSKLAFKVVSESKVLYRPQPPATDCIWLVLDWDWLQNLSHQLLPSNLDLFSMGSYWCCNSGTSNLLGGHHLGYILNVILIQHLRETGNTSTVTQPDNAEQVLGLERREEEACILLGLNRWHFIWKHWMARFKMELLGKILSCDFSW